MTEITLPQLGETMDEADILAWLKTVGERVERGEPLLEVQTDKISVEIPALESGVLSEILVEVGQSVKVGMPIARLDVMVSRENRTASANETSQARVIPEEVRIRSSAVNHQAVTERLTVRASPAARRLARELSIDLRELSGSGPHGRITSDDVRAAAVPQEPSPSPADEASVYQLTRVEQMTAQTTAQAFRDIPHFYVRTKVDATWLVRALEQLRAEGLSVTINDLLIWACARTLQAHPRLNASVDGASLRLHKDVHIGVITVTPQGLVSSVVRGADTLSPAEVHERVTSVRMRLQAGRAKPEDVSGATFCISNLGMYGVDEFSAIILPPNVGMLAVGAIREDVIIKGASLRLGKTLHLTLSADHRALGGVEAASFLKDLKEGLESPAFLGGAHG